MINRCLSLLSSAFVKEKEPELRPELPLQGRILHVLRNGEFSKSAIAEKIGHKTVSGELNKQVRNLIRAGFIEYTIPKKPNSPKQKYRLTSKAKKPGYKLNKSGRCTKSIIRYL